ncbi:50S ribosomal protein L5 [Candidatus Gottesmanbacteria bacterium]|nr:50S ribosomal protein L5 [Candidatus Gottesmanbacteria bacterium]
MNTLYEQYMKEFAPALKKELRIANIMSVPKLIKIVVNCGIGREAVADKKIVEKIAVQLAVVVGQKPKVSKAKKAISTFKLREGDPIGLSATLRGTRMYDFFQRLTSIALPRVRDFRGVSLKGFDGHGNFTMGISEMTIFPELEFGMVDKSRGMEITCVTTTKTDSDARALLEKLGLPFEKGQK